MNHVSLDRGESQTFSYVQHLLDEFVSFDPDVTVDYLDMAVT